MIDTSFKPCAVIPVYNHSAKLRGIVAELLARDLPVILVDDGSDADCRQVIEAICLDLPETLLISRAANCGKGAALKDGLRAARAAGFSHALQIDADGQHDRHDVERFLALAARYPQALVYGYPLYDETVPRHRLYGRYATHVWVWINTLSLEIRDAMCGFRIYPLAESCALLDSVAIGNRMEFDAEFIVHWHWRGQSLEPIATKVTYPADGISHFRLWRDNWLISWMHTRLFFGMLARLPLLVWRNLKRGMRDHQP